MRPCGASVITNSASSLSNTRRGHRSRPSGPSAPRSGVVCSKQCPGPFGVRRPPRTFVTSRSNIRFQLRQYPESLAGLLFAPHRRGISILTITFSRPTSHRQTLSGEMKEKLHIRNHGHRCSEWEDPGVVLPVNEPFPDRDTEVRRAHQGHIGVKGFDTGGSKRACSCSRNRPLGVDWLDQRALVPQHGFRVGVEELVDRSGRLASF
jgi:hypothetical protein